MRHQEEITAMVLNKWKPGIMASRVMQELWTDIRDEFIQEFEIYDPDHFDRREFIEACDK